VKKEQEPKWTLCALSAVVFVVVGWILQTQLLKIELDWDAKQKQAEMQTRRERSRRRLLGPSSRWDAARREFADAMVGRLEPAALVIVIVSVNANENG
jgi:hypothetical protein